MTSYDNDCVPDMFILLSKAKWTWYVHTVVKSTYIYIQSLKNKMFGSHKIKTMGEYKVMNIFLGRHLFHLLPCILIIFLGVNYDTYGLSTGMSSPIFVQYFFIELLKRSWLGSDIIILWTNFSLNTSWTRNRSLKGRNQLDRSNKMVKT